MLATAALAQTPTRTPAPRPAKPAQPTGMLRPVVGKNVVNAATAFDFTRKAASTAGETLLDPSELITEQPDGTLYDKLYRFTEGYAVDEDVARQMMVDGSLAEMVKSADGHFYLKNPVSGFTTNSWLKGVQADGDTVEFKLPQVVYRLKYTGDDGEEQEQVVYAWKMVPKPGTGTMMKDKSQTMKFVWRNDSLIKTSEDPSEMLALGNDQGEWFGYGDTVSVFNNVKEGISRPKSTDGAKTYLMQYSYYNYNEQAWLDVNTYAELVEDGNDVYLSGFNGYDSWIKGKRDGNKITFDQDQYLGIDAANGCHVYFLPVQITDEEWVPKPQLTLTENSNGDLDMDDDYTAFNNQGTRLFDPTRYAMNYSYEPAKTVVAAPADPEISLLIEYKPNWGFGGVKFHIPSYDADGNELNTAKIFYNVYVDGKKLTLDPKYYLSVKTPVTDIPYSQVDYMDIVADSNDNRTLYLFVPDYQTVGIQAFYVDGDKRLESNLVTSNVATGISAASDEGKDVKSVSYFDLSGRMVQQPTTGISIKKVVYADGTVKTMKAVKR